MAIITDPASHQVRVVPDPTIKICVVMKGNQTRVEAPQIFSKAHTALALMGAAQMLLNEDIHDRSMLIDTSKGKTNEPEEQQSNQD